MEERSTYEKDVIDASTEHVKMNRSDWVELAKESWKELEFVRNKICKKPCGRKRKKDEQHEDQVPEKMPRLPMYTNASV